MCVQTEGLCDLTMTSWHLKKKKHAKDDVEAVAVVRILPVCPWRLHVCVCGTVCCSCTPWACWGHCRSPLRGCQHRKRAESDDGDHSESYSKLESSFTWKWENSRHFEQLSSESYQLRDQIKTVQHFQVQKIKIGQLSVPVNQFLIAKTQGEKRRFPCGRLPRTVRWMWSRHTSDNKMQEHDSMP